MDKLRKNWLQFLAHFLSLLPLAVIAFDFTQRRLTANPIQEITLRTGMYSLILLVLSLACSPLARLFGLEQLARLRRPLGLYGFFYGALHLLNFIGLDYRFDFELLLADVGNKAHIWVGLVALLALVPVAVTSTRGWMKRLGKSWERLHWLVYPAALLAVLHFLLLVKADYREPALYGLIVILLLLLRLKWVKNVVLRLLKRRK
ncbi:MAG TPA: protein-methionine-sulfoxide reductase heme-binding subunit MsrQ [Dehalococcoidales bacterium]|nr:protein-methionine-sulfoxide reductase heme-binding subunit MsrQ [Dehalococcoidales bacterium]